jgi:hypothetical protein
VSGVSARGHTQVNVDLSTFTHPTSWATTINSTNDLGYRLDGTWLHDDTCKEAHDPHRRRRAKLPYETLISTRKNTNARDQLNGKMTDCMRLPLN